MTNHHDPANQGPAERPTHHQDPTTATYCVADSCHWDTRGTTAGAGHPTCSPGQVGAPTPDYCLLRLGTTEQQVASYRERHPGSVRPAAQQPATDQDLAARGRRCLEQDHTADLSYLSSVLDELAAARRRIALLEGTHPADLDDAAATLPTTPAGE